MRKNKKNYQNKSHLAISYTIDNLKFFTFSYFSYSYLRVTPVLKCKNPKFSNHLYDHGIDTKMFLATN